MQRDYLCNQGTQDRPNTGSDNIGQARTSRCHVLKNIGLDANFRRITAMEDFKSFIGASLVVALAVIIGLHLALLWSSGGELVIGETNEVLRVIESALAAGIFFFGIERLVAAIRRLSRRRD